MVHGVKLQHEKSHTNELFYVRISFIFSAKLEQLELLVVLLFRNSQNNMTHYKLSNHTS